MAFLVLLFLFEEFLLFIASLAKYKKRNLFQRTIYIIPPCPFRDILFFAHLIRVSSYLLFNYTYCFVLLPEHFIIKAKESKYRSIFISLLQNVGESNNLKIRDKYIENLAKFKYFGKITHQNDIHQVVKSKLTL
jgi:hypothetical protein